MMSLPARQQRALDRIERTLLAGDPRFGSLFAIFTRLASPEAMPRIEQVKPRRWQPLPMLAQFALIAISLALVVGVAVLGR